MTTYASAVFDNAIINAFNPAAGANQATWPTSASKVFCVLGNTAVDTNKPTYAVYNDIKYSTWEINTVSTGYTLGGGVMSTTGAALTTSVAKFIASAATVFSGTGTITVKTAVTQYAASSSVTTTNPLMSYHDLTGATGTSQTAVAGSLTLNWAVGGVFTITISGQG
jgi:hypothetical protein